MVKKIGFPLVDSVVQRSLVATGGTVLASKLAINYGIACNTAGGSHHANYNGGLVIAYSMTLPLQLII